MAHKRKPIRSDLGWSTPDRIVVRGKDLPGELLGKINLGDMAFLEVAGRLPTPQESTVFNAILVTLVEHGITPSAIAARMTYAGAPESLQAAVAAGLCGLGTVFVGSMEGAARMLYAALPRERARSASDAELDEIARKVVADYRARKEIIPGLGHPIHKPVDPRTTRLFELAAENGLAGSYVGLMNGSVPRPSVARASRCRSTPPVRSVRSAASSGFRGRSCAGSASWRGRSAWSAISSRRRSAR
jgi:citrate synthase